MQWVVTITVPQPLLVRIDTGRHRVQGAGAAQGTVARKYAHEDVVPTPHDTILLTPSFPSSLIN